MRTKLLIAIILGLFAWGNVSAETCTESLTVQSNPEALIKCLQQMEQNLEQESQNRLMIEKNLEKESQNRLMQALPIGTIIASMLPFEKFQKIADNTWKPADGRKVPTASKYAKLTGNKTLPDLRGMFLRGLNQFDKRRGSRRDEYKDPDGNRRKAGSPQKDATSLPKNKKNPFKGDAASAGVHSHIYFKARSEGARSGSLNRASSEASTTGSSGDHSHTVLITAGGDAETRPVNISVYYYIKID